MNQFSRKMQTWGAALALMCASGAAGAATLTYNYLITGDVLAGDEWGTPNAFNLTGGGTITAYGTFTADLSGGALVSFGAGSGNSMTIDLNGTLLSAGGDDSYGDGDKPALAFNGAMELTDFDYRKSDTAPAFNSLGVYFDDFDQLFGQWRADAEVTVVPLPAAAWLFGSGLLGVIAVSRRRKRA